MFTELINKSKLFLLMLFLSASTNLKASEVVKFSMNDCIFKVTNGSQTFNFNFTSLNDEVGVEINSSIILKLCKQSHYAYLNENGNLIDIGSKLSNAWYTGDHLKLVFTGRGQCSPSTLYTTIILLTCRLGTEIPYLDSTENCIFKIIWFSSFGCPMREVMNSCVIKTPSNSYNLWPLQAPSAYEYRSAESGKVLQFNICGYLLNSKCGPSNYLCETSKGNKEILSSSQQFSLTVTVSNIFLTYYKNNERGKIVIGLECTSGLTTPLLQFSHRNTVGDDYYVLYTTIVCIPSATECLVNVEEGYTYDISELKKYSGNWKVINSDSNLISFNVCDRLNYEPGLACSGGNIFACMQTTNGTISLGTNPGKLIINRTGELSLYYSGGAPCEPGSTYSLNITMKCHNVNSNPFLKQSTKCSHLIQWNTIAACPQKIVKVNKCFVDVINNINVTSLFTRDQIIYNQAEGTFMINLCKPLVNTCGGASNVSVCWVDGNEKEHAIGHHAKEPVYSQGRLKFEIFGEPCQADAIQSTIIFELKCDYSAQISKPVFIRKENNCIFFFTWSTIAACPAKTKVECIVEDLFNNDKYDLSALILNDTNYEVPYGNGSIYINICHSIVPNPNVRCWSRTGVGACYVKNNSLQSAHFGFVESPLQLVNKSLQLVYGSGDICTDGGSLYYTTVITFRCHKENNTSLPSLLSYGNCEYNLEWNTIHACPIKMDPKEIYSNDVILPKNVQKLWSCKIEAPHRFDLSPLMEQDWEIDKTLSVSVCRPLLHSNCSSSSASCLHHSSNSYVNMGLANNILQYRDGLLYLNYTGDDCRSTEIYFTCSEDATRRPVAVEDIDHCVTVIHWPTPLACQSEISKQCCDGREPGELCKLRGTYPIKMENNLTAYLNICKLPKHQVELSCGRKNDCIGNKISFSNTFSYEEANSTTSKAELHYVFGEICSGNVNKLYTIRVQMSCDPLGYDIAPRFTSIADDCTYDFKWNSHLFCKERQQFSSLLNCSSINKANHQMFLKNFQHFKTKNVTSKNTGYTYYFNFCDSYNLCKTDICIRRGSTYWDMFARINNIESKGNSTRLHFTSTTSPIHRLGLCGADVSLVCNTTVDEGSPIILQESECNLQVLWESKYACANKNFIEPFAGVGESSHNHAALISALLITLVILTISTGYFIWKKWCYLKMFTCGTLDMCRKDIQLSNSPTNRLQFSLLQAEADEEEIIFKSHVH